MDKLRELIFTAIGEASVCWKDRRVLKKAGTFDSDRATLIGEKLIEEILLSLESPLSKEDDRGRFNLSFRDI